MSWSHLIRQFGGLVELFPWSFTPPISCPSLPGGMVLDSLQASTSDVNQSMIATTYRKPPGSGGVMSAHHTWLGRSMDGCTACCGRGPRRRTHAAHVHREGALLAPSVCECRQHRSPTKLAATTRVAPSKFQIQFVLCWARPDSFISRTSRPTSGPAHRACEPTGCHQHAPAKSWPDLPDSFSVGRR